MPHLPPCCNFPRRRHPGRSRRRTRAPDEDSFLIGSMTCESGGPGATRPTQRQAAGAPGLPRSASTRATRRASRRAPRTPVTGVTVAAAAECCRLCRLRHGVRFPAAPPDIMLVRCSLTPSRRPQGANGSSLQLQPRTALAVMRSPGASALSESALGVVASSAELVVRTVQRRACSCALACSLLRLLPARGRGASRA